ncbi:hypothetical protein [Burkholderia cenocepacia]|uniref:hypothetical protein n=1 Tax=Burkholderia cenocepacia TaxID=95486 RepID=UPI00209AF031|nr:hypothetical protein [Burkholderia cenocepacia]
MWMLENAEVAAQLYRVVSVQEGDDDGLLEYTITATMHEPGSTRQSTTGTDSAAAGDGRAAVGAGAADQRARDDILAVDQGFPKRRW